MPSRAIAPRKVKTFCPARLAEGDAVSDGRRLQWPQGARFVPVLSPFPPRLHFSASKSQPSPGRVYITARRAKPTPYLPVRTPARTPAATAAPIPRSPDNLG